MDYVLFDIEFLDRDPGRYNVVVRCDLVAGDARDIFVPPSADPAFQQLIDRLQHFKTDEDMLIALGRQLFGALFQGKIRDAYNIARDKLPQGQRLRLGLRIDQSQAEVAGLPWEFLCDEEERPLVLLDTPIVRYPPRFKRPPTITSPRPLKILVTTAVTEPTFDPAGELNDLRATLAELEQAGAVQLHVEEHLTRPRFKQLLRQGFQIWHFIGHGKLKPDGTSGLLVFEDAGGRPDEISARELGITLTDSKLQLIVLEACNSAQLTTRPYRSIAPALMLADIGAVIAMQFMAPQEATRPFTSELYQALIDGEPIDACVIRGRRAVMDTSGLRNPDWGIPTVYTRALDARLFAPAPEPQPAPSDTSTPATGAPGGINVSIGNNNQLEGSPIVINGGASSREQSEDARYDQQLGDLSQLLAATRSKRSILQSKKAKLQASVGDLIELDETEKEYDGLRRQLLDLGKQRLSELERRAARPAYQGDRQLAAQIAELRLTVLEEQLDLAQREVFLLEANLKIQPNDRERQRVQQQLDAKNAEIADLKRQLERGRA